MASDANKQLVVRFYNEVWARGNVSFATEVFADDYVRHDLRATEAAPGRKVAEIWNHRDDLGLMEQLGAAVFAGAPVDDPS